MPNAVLSPEQLTNLWHLHGRRLLLVARSFGPWGEDAAQEAFLALARLEEPPQHTLAWLVTVARNQVLQWQRSHERRSQREIARTEAWFTPSTGHDPVDAAEATQALQDLPTELREVVTMHLWGELTFEQIAEVTGGSKSTVHRRFQAALELLRSKFTHPSKT